MCELCGDSKHIDVTVTVKGIYTHAYDKVQQAVETLCKAAGIPFEKADVRKDQEQSAYRAVRDLEAIVVGEVEERLKLVREFITSEWLRVPLEKAARNPFKISGRIYINPKTGKRLTAAEWKTITENLQKAFTWVWGASQEKIAATAIGLGMILRTMADPQLARDISINEVGDLGDVAEQAYTDALSDAQTFASAHAGEYIVDISTRARRAIANKILDGYQNRWDPTELERELYEEFGDMNRDWRRTAVTEIANNFNNGYLMSTLRLTPPAEDGHHYLIGITAPTACDHCIYEVKDRVVVVMDSPPTGDNVDGDEIEINGKWYTVIWPGKTNAGRPQDDWWVASGAQHPHCRCSWSSWEPGLEELEREVLKEAAV